MFFKGILRYALLKNGCWNALKILQRISFLGDWMQSFSPRNFPNMVPQGDSPQNVSLGELTLVCFPKGLIVGLLPQGIALACFLK
jgi:hypothetical protein